MILMRKTSLWLKKNQASKQTNLSITERSLGNKGGKNLFISLFCCESDKGSLSISETAAALAATCPDTSPDPACAFLCLLPVLLSWPSTTCPAALSYWALTTCFGVFCPTLSSSYILRVEYQEEKWWGELLFLNFNELTHGYSFHFSDLDFFGEHPTQSN